MKKLRLKELLVDGFIIWLIPFLISSFIFPLRTDNRGLFESIMPITIAFTVVFLSVRYFAKGTYSRKEGILVGLIWMLVSISIDSIMFIFGPINMSMTEYIYDIGLTYLLIPLITAGYADDGDHKKEA